MAHAHWEVAPGDELVPGRRVQVLLGGGERYEAFLIWNELLLCPTVVKILRPDMVDLPAARRTIAHEASILRRIEHPSFIRLFADGTEGPKPFIELEFLDGPRLSTLVRRHGILLAEQLFPLARQLAAALHYLHGQGIYHLDVKPRNIIMGPLPRLIDLSIARTAEQLANLRAPIGTDAYMAPEQCDRERLGEIGPGSDVWGLGVTLYQAASKRLPYPRGQRGGTDPERWPQLTHAPQPPPAKVSPKVAEVVMACFAPDPTERPSPLALFETFDDLAAQHGVAKLRIRLS